MLAKINRLAKDQDVKRVFRQGRDFFNPNFTVKYLANATSLRFAIVVSIKVFKKATKRNRLKRIIREFLKASLKKFQLGDYVVVAKPQVGKDLEARALESLKQLFIKANLLTL